MFPMSLKITIITVYNINIYWIIFKLVILFLKFIGIDRSVFE